MPRHGLLVTLGGLFERAPGSFSAGRQLRVSFLGLRFQFCCGFLMLLAQFLRDFGNGVDALAQLCFRLFDLRLEARGRFFGSQPRG